MFVSQGPLKAGGGDSWMSPINRQFSNMGLLVRQKMPSVVSLLEFYCDSAKQEVLNNGGSFVSEI